MAPRLGLTALAFLLAMGVAAHALDELNGRPLRTRIPDRVLIALAIVGLGGACAIGIAVAVGFSLWLLAFVAVGAFLVVAYNLELAGLHTDLWFGLAWGAFPVLTAAFAQTGRSSRRSCSRRRPPCSSRSSSGGSRLRRVTSAGTCAT